METMTVSQVSKRFGISARMLRYYEQAGLLNSFRQEDYAYRMYDVAALDRLRQILILRRLRIPVRQIREILQNPDAATAIGVFCRNIAEIDGEIEALSSIRRILSGFVGKLRMAGMQLNCAAEPHCAAEALRLIALDDALVASIEALAPVNLNFMEDKTMEHQKKTGPGLPKLTDVRIVYLPPSMVAAAHHIGDDPEYHANTMIDRFVRETGLHEKKPDLRHYGFNHPNPKDETDFHGYESWVTIPDDMAVPPPLEKKQFAGGLYAAHMIAMGNFNEWELLFDWVNSSDKYAFAGDMRDQEHMCGLLDEHLNYVSHIWLENTEPEDLQLDLLMPVREREAPKG